jgi:hypothetical protein
MKYRRQAYILMSSSDTNIFIVNISDSRKHVLILKTILEMACKKKNVNIPFKNLFQCCGAEPGAGAA